uniref:Uncharacterized protein n=1 Tax=Rhipicephalus zambeziensis TaxID=60191 RepID=A0A224YC37_9ACAR
MTFVWSACPLVPPLCASTFEEEMLRTSEVVFDYSIISPCHPSLCSFQHASQDAKRETVFKACYKFLLLHSFLTDSKNFCGDLIHRTQNFNTEVI